MSAPLRTHPFPPGNAWHCYCQAKAGVNATTTTVANHITAGNLQTWPTAAADITIESTSGATDDGRVIAYEGVDANYQRKTGSVVLDNSDKPTVNLLDITCLRDVTDDASAAAGNILATGAGSVVLARIDAGVGVSKSTRMYVPADHVGYLQTFNADTDQRFDDISVWCRSAPGTWIQELAFLAATGSNADAVGALQLSTPTSWGRRINGPCRVEVRAKTNSGAANIVTHMAMLFVPKGLAHS